MRKIFFVISSFFMIFTAASISSQTLSPPNNAGLSAAQYQEIVRQTDFEAKTLSVLAFMEKRDQENTVVIDLRSETEYDQSHVVGAIRLGINFTHAELQLVVPDNTTTILIYCSNSLLPTRKISLTYVGLPQYAAHGYNNAFMLADFFEGGDRSVIPMTGN